MKKMLSLLLAFLFSIMPACTFAEEYDAEELEKIKSFLDCSEDSAKILLDGQNAHILRSEMLYLSCASFLVTAQEQLEMKNIAKAGLAIYEPMSTLNEDALMVYQAGEESMYLLVCQDFVEKGKTTEGLYEKLHVPYETYLAEYREKSNSLLDVFFNCFEQDGATWDDLKNAAIDLCIDVWKNSYGGRFEDFSYGFEWLNEQVEKFEALRDLSSTEIARKLINYDSGKTYGEFNYKTYFRNPEMYYGDRYVIHGEVIQVIGNRTDGFILRVSTSENGYGDIIMAVIVFDPGYNIMNEDVLKLYVEARGTYTYEAMFGQEITIPFFNVEEIYLTN